MMFFIIIRKYIYIYKAKNSKRYFQHDLTFQHSYFLLYKFYKMQNLVNFNIREFSNKYDII